MEITWLGHACFLVEDTRGSRVIVDPLDVDGLSFASRGLKFAYPPIAGAVAGGHDAEGGGVRGANLLLRWEMEGMGAIFYVNPPIGLAACFWCRYVLPDVHARARRRFDWLGAGLAFAGLGCLLWFVDRVSARGWSWPTAGWGLAALVSLGCFVAVEKRAAEPMLDLGLFQSRVFSTANTAALLNFMSQYIIVFSTPFLLQQVLGYAAGRAGAIMTAFPLLVLVVSPFSGALSDRAGHRGLAAAGLAVCAGAGLLFAVTAGIGAWGVALYLAVFGLGTGLFTSPNNSAVMGSVPRYRLGVAGSVLATTRNTGMALGIMAAGAALNAAQAAHGGSLVAGLRAAYIVAAGLSLAGVLITFWGKEKRPEATQHAG